MKQKKLFGLVCIVAFIVLTSFVYAFDWIPPGDIDMGDFYSIENGVNATFGWFNGAFNWIVGSGSTDYLSFNGTQLDINETKLTSVYCKLTGCEMTGDLIIGDNNFSVTNVGIGTTSPSKTLEVAGSGGGNFTVDPTILTGPVLNTTEGNMTITSHDGSVVIRLGA